jgi:hypothetical protein
MLHQIRKMVATVMAIMFGGLPDDFLTRGMLLLLLLLQSYSILYTHAHTHIHTYVYICTHIVLTL